MGSSFHLGFDDRVPPKGTTKEDQKIRLRFLELVLEQAEFHTGRRESTFEMALGPRGEKEKKTKPCLCNAYHLHSNFFFWKTSLQFEMWLLVIVTPTHH